jgi:valyl-tRNA synthetase
MAAPPQELSKQYRPADHEAKIFAKWQEAGAFHADPGRVLRGEAKPYCILIPPPNVTDRLHLGHALNNTLQDVLVRAHRMMGFETLWMPGTDHAGIATQAVVEKRLRKEGVLKGPLKQSMQREEFVAKVQAFKDEYEAVITGQLKAMGCSCDWERQRFTMDPVCARAVREAFFRLFKDGLIYRGKRLVNWDPALQTAISDDEIEDIEVDGHFYYLRYPLVHQHGQRTEKEVSRGTPAPEDAVPVSWNELARRGYPGAGQHEGEEQAWVTVATTRPETYLGDTAVAVNPHDPRAKALRGLFVELPIIGRVIPVIEDDYVVLPAREGAYGKGLNLPEKDEPEDPKAAFATGFLKVTPAHDPNDYELGLRHKLPMINVMAPDASISDKHGWSDPRETAAAHIFLGRKREDARKLVVKEFEARNLLEDTKPYRHTVGHSDRSKAAIEPYLSDQWYVRVTDPRMAASANAALAPEQRSKKPSLSESSSEGSDRTRHARLTSEPSPRAAQTRLRDGDRSLKFHPDRYAKTYESWHDNIRDWCISRQLWWGHRIPVWTVETDTRGPADIQTAADAAQKVADRLDRLIAKLAPSESVAVRRNTNSDGTMRIEYCARTEEAANWLDAMIDILNEHTEGSYLDETWTMRLPPDEVAKRRPFHAAVDNDLSEDQRWLRELIFEPDTRQDPDVLDTWFSSALWPMSTMGWPDAELAAKETGITDFPSLLPAFNPSSTLCTAREIITLWVSRMVMFNRYFMGEGQGKGPLPYKDVYIHCVVQDGQGRKMSKSLGNGVDPLDIIASHGTDAMRFAIAQMATQTQDVRLPVKKDSATGKNTSDKFDLGRNFANKVWNAASFALRNLSPSPLGEGRGEVAEHPSPDSALHAYSPTPPRPSPQGGGSLPDRWMLSRLASAVADVESALANFEFSGYAQTVYDLLWRDFCDWYLEAIKPTVAHDPGQRAVLAATLDTILRLLHPIMPYVTEAIYEQVRGLDAGPVAGVTLGAARKDGLLATAPWPKVDSSLRDERAEADFERVRSLVTSIREVRSAHQVPQKANILLVASPQVEELFRNASLSLVDHLAVVKRGASEPATETRISFQWQSHELSLVGALAAVDAGAEKGRLTKLIAGLEKEETTLLNRLANPAYAEKAPPAMVQQTKDRLEKVRAELAAARKALEALQVVGS